MRYRKSTPAERAATWAADIKASENCPACKNVKWIGHPLCLTCMNQLPLGLKPKLFGAGAGAGYAAALKAAIRHLKND